MRDRTKLLVRPADKPSGNVMLWAALSLLAASFFSLAACGAPAPVQVRLETVVQGLSQPVQVLQAPGDDAALYIVEKTGRIRMAQGGRLFSQAVLDLSGIVSRGGEQGLLGAAFHPDFQQNGWLFVNYTDTRGDTRIVRYTVDRSTGLADPSSAKLILTIAQPASNHNGGMLAFGPDGYLYIGTGDGGRAGDPWGNAQNLGTLLGKILRIDVDRGDPYGVPEGNPFADAAGARPEIWAYGLRNPWRFSFDRATGDLYIADVGQNAWEEVNVQAAGSRGGENYGWNLTEGRHCYPQGRACSFDGFALPVAEYSHGQGGGCSITGGYVYRGSAIPELAGRYVFGDYCTGTIWAIQGGAEATGLRALEVLVESGLRISGFGEDHAGELYVTSLDRGVVCKIVRASGP